MEKGESVNKLVSFGVKWTRLPASRALWSLRMSLGPGGLAERATQSSQAGCGPPGQRVTAWPALEQLVACMDFPVSPTLGSQGEPLAVLY